MTIIKLLKNPFLFYNSNNRISTIIHRIIDQNFYQIGKKKLKSIQSLGERNIRKFFRFELINSVKSGTKIVFSCPFFKNISSPSLKQGFVITIASEFL